MKSEFKPLEEIMLAKEHVLLYDSADPVVAAMTKKKKKPNPRLLQK